MKDYNVVTMKKTFLFSSFFFLLSSLGAFAYSSDDMARANLIAQAGLIVSQEDNALYRLDDSMLRQELIGTALKLAGTELPKGYTCKGYFSDANF